MESSSVSTPASRRPGRPRKTPLKPHQIIEIETKHRIDELTDNLKKAQEENIAVLQKYIIEDLNKEQQIKFLQEENKRIIDLNTSLQERNFTACDAAIDTTTSHLRTIERLLYEKDLLSYALNALFISQHGAGFLRGVCTRQYCSW